MNLHTDEVNCHSLIWQCSEKRVASTVRLQVHRKLIHRCRSCIPAAMVEKKRTGSRLCLTANLVSLLNLGTCVDARLAVILATGGAGGYTSGVRQEHDDDDGRAREVGAERTPA